MSGNSETGHAKNMANFDGLISFVIGYGEKYNPTKSSIKLDALQSLSAKGKEALNAVNSALPAYSNAVAARETAFKPLSKLATRILNALKATDTTESVDANVQTLIRKIQGRRATAKRTEEQKNADAAAGKEASEISASQMSFDSRLDNFDKLIKLLSSVELYAPNEADLKVATLSELINDLKIKNSAVVNATIPLSNGRISRDSVLYKELTGLVDISLDVKSYVKSVFGAGSSEYRQISGIKFTTPR